MKLSPWPWKQQIGWSTGKWMANLEYSVYLQSSRLATESPFTWKIFLAICTQFQNQENVITLHNCSKLMFVAQTGKLHMSWCDKYEVLRSSTKGSCCGVWMPDSQNYYVPHGTVSPVLSSSSLWRKGVHGGIFQLFLSVSTLINGARNGPPIPMSLFIHVSNQWSTIQVIKTIIK